MKRLNVIANSLLIFLLLISNKSFSQMNEIKINLAMVQLNVEGGNPTNNIIRAKKMIAEAAQNNAQIVLLPEAMDLGWTHPSALTKAYPIPGGKTYESLAQSAVDNGVYVCAGIIEKDGDKVYNSAVIISPEGELLLKHRKINELKIGHKYYALGENLNVCDTEYGRIGLMICADANAKGKILSRSLAMMGAELILSPCSWAVPADFDNEKKPYGDTWYNAYSPVAKEFSVWIAGCSNVGLMTDGPWKGWKGIGCSLVVDTEGNEQLKGPYGADAETILYIEIEPVKHKR